MLSRQRDESMISYVNRRKRWFTLLKQMDPQIGLSDEIQGDLMLENAGLTQQEQLMVLTSTANYTTVFQISEALIKQHPKIHMKSASLDIGYNKPWRHKPHAERFRKPFKRYGNIVDAGQCEHYDLADSDIEEVFNEHKKTSQTLTT